MTALKRKCSFTQANKPFTSSLQSLVQRESMYETFVMAISSNFSMNEN